MAIEYYAHTREDPETGLIEYQTVEQHLRGTAELCAEFADKLNAKEYGELVGSLHDYGKCTLEFLNRILNSGPKVDHSTAGAIICDKKYHVFLAACIAGHHSGLPDFGNRNADTANSAESVSTVGGVDGPTDIYIASFGDINLVRQPRLFVNGEDATLCVADVSGIVECPEGTLMLALVCRAGETDGASLHVTIDNNGFWTELNAENWAGGELEDWMNAVNPDAAGAEISAD